MYLRKSRADTEAEARGEGETLARHEAALQELARRQNLPVIQVYRELVSGESIAARPVMQQILAEIGQGQWTGVLVMEVERLARGDTIDQGYVSQTFKYSGTKIITPLKTYDPSNEFDEEYFEFGLFMSRREYKVINRRLQRGRLASVREGKFVGSKAPYGYARQKLEHGKGFTLVPIPEQADVIRLIFALYTLGAQQENGEYRRLGLSLIARRLNTLRLPSQSGREWTSPTIRDILINPVYIGKVRWNWRPVSKRMVGGKPVVTRARSLEHCVVEDGLHEPILQPGVYEKAQELLKLNPPKPVGERHTVQNPLSGLVVCGNCNRHMVRRPYSREYPDTLMCPTSGCGNVSSRLALVETQILTALAAWVDGYTLSWEDAATAKTDTLSTVNRSALRRLEVEIDSLRKQRGSLHDLLEQGIYDADTFHDRLHDISERLNRAKVSHQALSGTLPLVDKRRSQTPATQSILYTYSLLPTPKAKNDLLKVILEKVVYRKERGEPWHRTPDTFELTLYPKLPHWAER